MAGQHGEPSRGRARLSLWCSAVARHQAATDRSPGPRPERRGDEDCQEGGAVRTSEKVRQQGFSKTVGREGFQIRLGMKDFE